MKIDLEMIMNLIGISGAVVGLISYWRGAIEKQYAAKAAFTALTERQLVLEQNMNLLSVSIEEWHKYEDQRLDKIEQIVSHNDAMLSQHDRLLQILINSSVTQQ